MPFIGQQPVTGAYHKLDAITASATATYNLLLNGGAYSPASANHLLVSLNGVMQAPQDSFTVSGSTIIFDSALTSSDNIDFIMALGDVLNIGTPSDGTVSASKIATNAVTSTKLASTLDLSGTGRTGHGGLKSVQVFTSSGTYTKPTGISTVKVIVTGAGGSGGGHGSTDDMGAGGGAGGTAIEVIDISGVSTVTVTVGTGGAGVSGGTDGNAGGTSSFGSYCSATGGSGGNHGNDGDGIGGGGGSGTGGNINILGGAGGNGWDNFNVTNTYARGFGFGGSSFWGGGGRGSSYTNIAASSGRAYGSGGGAPHSRHGGTSGAGAAGVVYVEEYA